MTTSFDQYSILRVRDARPDSYVQYAVTGCNNINVDEEGWQMPDQKVLYTTDLGDYDGGHAACEAFIEGYKSALPPTMFTSVASG